MASIYFRIRDNQCGYREEERSVHLFSGRLKPKSGSWQPGCFPGFCSWSMFHIVRFLWLMIDLYFYDAYTYKKVAFENNRKIVIFLQANIVDVCQQKYK